jgi:hypothetical protein
MAMKAMQNGSWASFLLSLIIAAVLVGCQVSPVDTSEYARGPAPLREPSPGREGEGSGRYEDQLTGGHIFEMYCSSCHNARALAERPFASYQNAATHMRVVAGLTGKEHAKLMEFMRRWADVPPPNPPVEPSPKRFFFSQPIAELRPQTPAGGAAPKPQAQQQSPTPDSPAAVPPP